MECVAEDEMYLESTTFYKDCDIASLGNPFENDLFENVAADKCSESRRCEGRSFPSDDNPFVGYDPFGNCTCPMTRPPKVLYTYHGRVKRQTGETFVVGGTPACRVQRARRGRKRIMCDMLVIARSTRYDRSVKIAGLEDLAFNIVQDPAICGVFADGCI